jgi:phage portal protein BeeE
MTSAITKALADVSRSYVAAKAAVANVGAAMLASGPTGLPTHRADLSRASEQLRHFTGWVYASIRPIAQRIAGQPIHVGHVRQPNRLGTKQAKVEALQTHPLLDLLADPNDLMVSWSLMFTTVASLELTGRALWWLPGKKQILPIPTSWIVAFEGSTKFTAFKVRPPHTGEAFDIPADECCYFSYPDPADPHGAVSPLQAAGGAVDADEAMTASQISMFRRGIHPSHAIIVGKAAHPDVPSGVRPRLTDAQQRQIIGAIRKRYADVGNHGEPLILDGLIEDVKRLSSTPAEMDWLNSGKTTKARIMQVIGTNPIIAGEIEGANRAADMLAVEHAHRMFLIRPVDADEGRERGRRRSRVGRRGGWCRGMGMARHFRIS